MDPANEPGAFGTPIGPTVALTIDRRPVTVAVGASVFEAARAAGIALPNLCAGDPPGALGSCRLCLVEIDACSGTPASCTTPARNGMVVRTRSALLGRIRRGVLELTLSDHRPDCPTCATGGHRDLAALAESMQLRHVGCGRLEDGAAATQEPTAPIGRPDHAALTTCTGCVLGCTFRPEPRSEPLRLTPYRNGDIYRGRSCATGRLAWGYAQHSERIVRPLIRAGIADPWREVSWEAAFAHVASELRRIQRDHGRRSIGAVTASTCTNEEAYLVHKLVRAGFGNNNVDSLGRPRGFGSAGSSLVATFPHEFSGYRHVSDEPTRRAFEAVWGARLDPEPGLGFSAMLEAALTGSFKGLLVQGEDVVKTEPGPTAAALSAMDCVVVQDLFFSETARFAHVFLPASSFLEKDGTITDRGGRIRRLRKAMAPRAVLADWEITLGLAAALDYTMSYADPGRILDEIAATTPTFAGVSFAALDALGPMHWPSSAGTPDDVPATPFEEAGRGQRASDVVECFSDSEGSGADAPLLLTVGPGSHRYGARIHPCLDRPLRWHEEDCLEMHPDDAKRRGLRAGDWVKLESAAGETIRYLHVTHRVAPGIVAETVNAWATEARISPGKDLAADVDGLRYSAADVDGPRYSVTPVEVSASKPPTDWLECYEDWCRKGRMA